MTAAVLTISLTLGAGTAIFTVVDAVLLTPPPLPLPEQLIIGEAPFDDTDTTAPRRVGLITLGAWRARAGSFATFEVFEGTNLTLTALGPAERLRVTDATPGLLGLLGVTPTLGRVFDTNDVGQPVVVVSHAFWRGRLAGDPAAIGREVTLGDRAHTVVGVLPAWFHFPLADAEVWRPLDMLPAQTGGDGLRVSVLARLEDASSTRSLAAALDEESRAATPPARAVVTRLTSAIVGDRSTTLTLLLGAAALALAIALANLAGLMMVRSLERRRELPVRTALGAPQHDILRQLLLDAGTIVALGTCGAVALAWWMTPVIADLLSPQALEHSRQAAPTLTWRVMTVVACVAVTGTLICGALPAWVSSRGNLVDLLRRGATPAVRDLRVRRVFVVAEVAVACVLLVSMSLLGRSLLAPCKLPDLGGMGDRANCPIWAEWGTAVGRSLITLIFRHPQPALMLPIVSATWTAPRSRPGT